MSWESLKTWLQTHNALGEGIESPGQIRRLDLSGRGIDRLPDSIGLLDSLVALNLANNLLESLPQSIDQLQALVNLDLRRNRFQALPTALGALQLRSLNASDNQLSDISVLEHCPELRVLDLSGNSLAELGACLHVQNELRSLNLSMNYLGDLEAFFAGLGNVEQLMLADNLLRELPSSIGHLESLLTLDVSGNRLERLDDAFFTLDVETVDLSSNAFGDLHLHGLEDLESIELDDNAFTSLTIDDDFAPHLTSFSCDGCELEIFLLPPSLHLETLCYSANDLCDVPEEIARYTKLGELDIDNNMIETIPDTFTQLGNLHTLYADGNPFTPQALALIASMQIDVCDLEMKADITIRDAVPGDIPAMSELIGVLFAIESDFRADPAKQADGLSTLIATETADLLVAVHGERVIGMVTMQRLVSSAEGGEIGQIEDLVVDEHYRRMGVGSRLVSAIKARGAKHDYRRLQLAADKDNATALAFYARKGFRRTNLSMFHLVAFE